MDSTPNKRTIILETTLELVRERGIHGFPISDVAKEGGIAVGTIYHYFEGKEQLIQELYQYVVELIYLTAIEEDDPGKSFQERYFIFWNNLVNLYNAKPYILSFVVLYKIFTLGKEEYGEEREKFYDWVCRFFEQVLKSGDFRASEKDILAVLVLGLMLSSDCLKM